MLTPHRRIAQVHESIAKLNAQRGLPGDEVVETATAALRHQLADLNKEPATSPPLLMEGERRLAIVGINQRRFDQAEQTYRLAESMLGPVTASADAAWWQEWMQVQLDRMWLCYWRNQVRELIELANKILPVMEQYATPLQRAKYFQGVAMMEFRRDRYVLSVETVTQQGIAGGE